MEYVEEFDILMLCYGVVEPEERIIACYLGGLKCDINNKIQVQSYISINDIVKLSIKVEHQLSQW